MKIYESSIRKKRNVELARNLRNAEKNKSANLILRDSSRWNDNTAERVSQAWAAFCMDTQ